MVDFESRAVLQATILRLQGLIVNLNSAKIAHDFDNYQASRRDYDFSKYKNDSGMQGYEVKVNELAQFFTGGANSNTKNTSDEETKP